MGRTRDHIFALMVHGGILFAIFVLVLATSCRQEPPPPEPDPVGDFFENLMDNFDEIAAESVTVIAVDDNIGAGDDLARQVYQEIQTELDRLGTIAIREFPKPFLEEKFSEMGIVPSNGISPEDAMALADDLNVDSLLYASIESETPDVHIKLYSRETGALIFAETLQAWPLSVSRQEKPADLMGLTEEEAPETETPEEESAPPETPGE